MANFFMTDAQVLVQSSPSMRLRELLDWLAIEELIWPLKSGRHGVCYFDFEEEV